MRTSNSPLLALLFFLTAPLVSLAGEADPARPNVIVLIADDLGAEGLGCYGSTTPLWTNGKDTRAGNFTANGSFKDLKIRAVSVAEAGK